jgi:hypothetical protein
MSGEKIMALEKELLREKNEKEQLKRIINGFKQKDITENK